MADIGITLRADATGLQRSLNDAAGSVQAFSRNSGDSLKSVGLEATSLQSTMEGFANGLKSALLGSSMAVGLIGLKSTMGELRQELIATQVQADKMRNGLTFAVGKSEVAGEMAFIKKSAQDLGLELATTSAQYTKLAAAAHGTTLAGQGVRDIFTAMGQAGAVMGLSAQEMDGALLAVTQMISKGKVQAEELRGQLGERLPGAFQIAARSMGVTTAELDKMLETGKVLASDFLPKFAAQLSKEVAPQVEAAAQSMQASINRLENSYTSLKRAVNEGGVGKFMQNEMTGMSNYVQGVADAMVNARNAGGGGLSQANAALGNVIGRMPFDALSLASNTLNTALNALSMGALKLNTNLNLLPEVFKTNEQQMNNLVAALPAAEDKLAKLQARLAKVPDNIYLKDEVYQLSVFIAKAKEAKAASDRLKGLATEDPTKAGIKAGGIARESYMAEQKQLGEDMVKIRMKLSGVDADYLPTLTKLQAARESGVITEKMYIDTVTDLAKANFKKAASEKVQGDSAVQDLKARIATERQYIQALQDMGLEADKANEGEKLASKLTQELAGKMDAKIRLSKQAQLLQANILADTLKERDALKDTLTTREKANKAANKEYLDQSANTEKINERAAAIELEVVANVKLPKAIEQVAIARLKEERDTLKFFDNSKEKINLIEEEIKARERLIVAMDSKDSSDAIKKSAKEAQAEWKRASDEINRSITDALMRAFEDGSSFGQAFVRVLEAEFKTLVLRPMVSAVMTPVSGVINSVVGGIGGGNSAPSTLAGVGNTASGLGGLSNLFGAGGILGSNAAYGAALGTTSIGAGSQAAMLAAQTGDFGLAGLTATGSAAGGVTGTIASVIGAIPGWGWAAMGTAALLGISSGYDIKPKGNAIVANIGSDGALSVASRTDTTQTGHHLLGGDVTTTNSAWTVADTGTTKYIDSAVKLITNANKGYAAALGLDANAINGFTKQITVDVTGMTAAQAQSAINAELAIFAIDQVNSAYSGAISSLAKDGETGAQTLQRVATDLSTVNTAFDTMGLTLYDVSVKGAAAAEGLISTAGGLDVLMNQLQSYYQNFYSQAERDQATYRSISKIAAQNGYQVTPEQLAGYTKEQVRAFIDGIDQSTEDGRKLFALLMSQQAAWFAAHEHGGTGAGGTSTTSVSSAASELAAAQKLANEAQAAIDRQIADNAAAAAAAQASALQDAVQYLAGATGNINQWLNKLNTTDAGGLSPDQQRTNSWASLQSQLVLAQGGSRDAMSGITGYADTYISAIKATAKSFAEEQSAISRVKAQVGNLPAQVSAEQFIVNAIDKNLGNTGDIAKRLEELKTAKIIADLTVNAISEITKLIKFVTDTDLLPADLKTLAMAESGEVLKTIKLVSDSSRLTSGEKIAILDGSSEATRLLNLALGNVDMSDDYKRLALNTYDNILKTVNFAVTDIADPAQRALALSTTGSVLKTISAAAGAMDSNALLVAAAQSATINKIVTASGGVLTADQQLLLNNITSYNKEVQIIISQGSIKTVDSFMATHFGSQTVDVVVSMLGDADVRAMLSGYINDVLRQVREGTIATGAGVADVYAAAKRYKFTEQDIALASGYSLGEVQNLFDSYGIPRFAVGTDLVPRDMLAMIHQGEQIVPKAYNPHANGMGGGGGQNLQALQQEIAMLRADARASQIQMASLMARLTKTHERWDSDGLPTTRAETA